MFPIEMGWRHLLFANWPVEPALVSPHLPDSLEVDEYDGQAWLSVVPFVNVDVRPRGLPPLASFELPELNLRTYVRCEGEPGVYFFSLDAEGVLGVLGARVFHHLPYYYARIALGQHGNQIRFTSRRRHPGARPVSFEATYEPIGEPFPSREDPLAAFLTERYRFYTEDSSGTVRYADIEHESWTVREATAGLTEDTLFRANGFETPAGDPICYYARGVDVTASRSKRFETVEDNE